MIGYCLTSLLFHAALASSTPPIVLVHNGKPQAVIVAPPEAHGDLAAAVNDLQAYIQKISGARLSIVAKPVAGRAAIVLRSHVGGLSEVGYRLRTQDGHLFIEGATEAGVVNGIYGFLEDHLGVRWYIPGTLGEYVPKRKRILLSAIHETREPAIPSVTGFGGYQADPPKGAEWRRRNRLAGFQPYWHSHNWEGIIPSSEAHAHPEWFALIEGERKWQLCTTHPDVLRIAIQRVLEYFKKNPQAKTFSLSPNDYGRFCQCERCRALDRALGVDPFAPEGQFTDRLVHFFNQIAEEVTKHYPDKLLCFYAYLTHTDPPQKVKPHPNLMPVICHTPWEFCHAHPITAECAPCTRFRQIVQRWRALCAHVGIYDYYGHWQWFGQWPLVHTLKVDIPFYAKVGIEHLNSETHDNWWTQPLNILAAVKLAWNPQTNTEALMRDFCRHLFAESREPVYRYFTMYENLMASMPLDAKNHEDWWVYPSGDVMEKGRKLLEEAWKKANSEMVRQRVRRLQMGHRIYTLQWQVATARRTPHVGRAWEAARRFALSVQELNNSGLRDVIDLWLAQQEALQHGSEAQAYMELLTAAGYTTLEAREQALREAEVQGADFARKLGFLTEWQVIGPFPCKPGELSRPDIPVDVLHPSERFTTPLGEVGWRKVSISHPFGLLNLRPLLPKGSWLSAYAACWVKLPGAISLRLGSNDGAAVWLDGKLLLVSDVPRGFQPDQDRVSMIGGDDKWHLLVVKVMDYGGSHWNMAVRFADAGGRPLRIPYSAVPPDASVSLLGGGVAEAEPSASSQNEPAGSAKKEKTRRNSPFVLLLPAYRNAEKVIEAWNEGLGRADDIVVCIPAPQDLPDPARIETIFRQVQHGSLGWVTPSAKAVLKGEAKVPPAAKWLWYDLEPWPYTPQEEKEDPVAAIKLLRAYCDQHKLKLGITPIYSRLEDNLNLELAAKVAAHCDAYILQCQDWQKDSQRRQRIVSHLRDLVRAIHTTNPKCLVGCQLGAAERYGGVRSALALYADTQDFLQIYTAWWEPEEFNIIALLKDL